MQFQRLPEPLRRVWGAFVFQDRRFVTLLGVFVIGLTAARGENPSPSPASSSLPALAPFKDPDAVTLAFLQNRVAADPDDVTAQNRLASEYLRRLRLSGDLAWLDRAAEAARRSLSSVAGSQNPAGLAAQARVQFESHRFLDAVATLRLMRQYATDKPYTLALLGDALLEAGDYDAAADAYRNLRRLSEDSAEPNGPDVELRFAKLAWLHGDDTAARAGYEKSVTLAAAAEHPTPELVAYCHVQFGQFLFGIGDWPGAETHYLAALSAQPGSFAAVEHLAELAGARGDLPRAASLFQEVIGLVPRPEFCHELGDLYLFFNKPEDARPWLDKALTGYQASLARGESQYDHHLAAFYSDSREAPKDALAWAHKDMELRHSIFAYDALGWALYKNGSFAEAAAAMDKAVVLGCRSTHLIFHAGMVYFRAGNPARGSEFLRRAYEINPRQDTFHVHR